MDSHDRQAPEAPRPTDPRVLILAGTVLAMLIGLAVAWQALRDLDTSYTMGSGLGFSLAMTRLDASTAEDLQTELDRHGYEWPPSAAVPRINVKRFPDDMDELDTEARKSVFLRSLLPLILRENAELQYHRNRLEGLLAGTTSVPEPGTQDHAYLRRLQDRFRVSGPLDHPDTREALLRRVDEIPVSLALAQAANESGWGTSRFTREANNLFGEWTWRKEQGIIPAQRAEGATHRIRVFRDLQASVRSYMHNINVGSAYTELRRQRADARTQGNRPDGLTLAAGLVSYSERGEAYVDEIRSMIRQNALQDLPAMELDRN